MNHFNLLVGNLPTGRTESEVHAYFASKVGPLDIILKEGSEGEHYCLLETPAEHAYRCLLSCNGETWDGCALEIRPPLYQPPAERTLHAKRVPSDLTDQEIRAVFERFGSVERLKVVRRIGHAFAFVTFREQQGRDTCLDRGQDLQLGNTRLQLQPPPPPSPPPSWSRDQFDTEIVELARVVESDVNFRDLEARMRTLHTVRHALFGNGIIGLSETRLIEARLQEVWTIKERRLQRAHQEFESDLISVEQDLQMISGEEVPWEGFARLAEDLRNVESYLQSLGLPTDRERFFQKKLDSLGTLLAKRWLARVTPLLDSIANTFLPLDTDGLAGYEALLKQYSAVGALRDDLVAFSAIFHHPPLRSISRSPKYQRSNSHYQEIWDRRRQRQATLLKSLRSEANRMVEMALQAFFDELGNPQTTLRERSDALDDVDELIRELRPRIAANEFERYQECKSQLQLAIRNAREELIQRVEAIVSESVGHHPDPEALLEEIKQLHRDQRTIPLRGNIASRMADELRDAWEQINRQVAERHRIASEHLSAEVATLSSVIDTERPDRLFPRLRNLSDRIKQSRLSSRWKSILENQLSDLYEAVDVRRNRDHEAALQIVEAVEQSVENGATMAEVRDAIRQSHHRLEQLVLHKPLREELLQRLTRLHEVFEAANEQAANQIEPQVAACEDLAKHQRFDRIFSEVNRLQQEISRAGATPRLLKFRRRLNAIWQTAQESQKASASLLESLITDRISACERLAQDEPDFREVHAALAEAARRFRERPQGLRLSLDASVYQQRIDEAFQALRAREHEAGNETRGRIETRAAAIRRQLRDNTSLGAVFQNLQDLSEYKRCHWKNQQDMEHLDSLIDQLWTEAKQAATEKRSTAIETARIALEHSTLLAARWFDWRNIHEELKNTRRLLQSLPLSRDLREKLLEHVDLQYDHVRLRQRADENEEFSREWLTYRRAYCIKRGMVSIANQRWPADSLGSQDLTERELFVLTHIYDIIPRFSTDSEGNAFNGIEYDERSLDWVRIKKYRLPAIWYQPFTSVLIEFPVAYPHTPPIGWYMDDKLNLRGWREASHYFPNRAFHGAVARQGMAWYCCTVQQIGGAGGWRPATWNNPRQRDNLWSFLDIVRTALSSDD